VVLISESDKGLAAFAKKYFPKAYIVKDVRDIPDLVRSGKLQIKADFGMASFHVSPSRSFKTSTGIRAYLTRTYSKSTYALR